MADAEQLALIRRSVEEWNAWRENSPEVQVDLSEAPLHETFLQSANLGSANLCRASLNRAMLEGADLRESNLGGADLYDADLAGADLTAADLREANLGGANLYNADFSRTKLSGAAMRRTFFSNTNLKDADGLDSCIHWGPSTVDYLTLARSWPVSPIFLRDCGLPDSLITHLPSLIADGTIPFYSCFISYSTEDQEFANRLYTDLRNKGVRCWFAPHDARGGEKLHEQINTAIRMHERLLLILSPNSINSAWVETEIRYARRRERNEKKRVLFPVRLASYDALREWNLFDADEGRDLAAEIRKYYIPNFSEWKSHDPYQKEFEKLLRDLRTEGAK